MKPLVILLAAATALSSCGRIPIPFTGGGGAGPVEFDGLRFRARTRAVTPDRRGFAVTVQRASRSFDAAREAGRLDGIAYCLDRFGGSDIAWAVGPEAEGLTLREGALVLSGTCTTR